MLERKWFFFLHFRVLLPAESSSYRDSLPPSPGENTTDLHVHKHDRAVGICWVLGKVSGSEVGAGMLGGKPNAGWGPLQVHRPPLQLPCPHSDLSFTKHLTPL